MQEYKFYLTLQSILRIILLGASFGLGIYTVYKFASVDISTPIKVLCAISLGWAMGEAASGIIESLKKSPFDDNSQINSFAYIIGETAYTKDGKEIGLCKGIYTSQDFMKVMVQCGKDSKLMDLSELWFKDYEYYEEDEEEELI